MSVSYKRLLSGGMFLFLLAGCAAAGADWPQYRGPNHDGTSSEKISKVWPANGPAQVWKVSLQDGFSAITVADGQAFTLVTREVEGASQEVCVALDAASGKEQWFAALGVGKYDSGGNSGVAGNDGGDGPRSTPAYSDGMVYAYSSRMVLKCFDAASGRQIWKSDIISEHEGSNVHWGNAASPLVEGDLVIVPGGGAGQSILAFNKKDGKVVWKSGNDKLTQSTPIAATILGVRQVIFITGSGLESVKASDGEALWHFSFKIDRAVGMSPVVAGDLVYCSVAYGLGSRVCKVSKDGDKFTVSELWFIPGNNLANHWATPVCADGYLYGLFGQARYAEAPLECVQLATGKVMWSKGGFGPGGCTLVDGHVLVLSDAGDLVLVKATAEHYTEVARSRVLTGKCWNGVGISNGRVYARSTKEGVCLDVSVKTAMK